MTTADDTILLAVRSLENVIKSTKQDTREQLGKSNLISINSYCNNILRVVKSNQDDKISNVRLLLAGVSELSENYYKSEDFIQTDTETKNYIYDKLVLALDELVMYASEFYLDRHFNYNARLEPVLNSIVDRRLREDINYFD